MKRKSPRTEPRSWATTIIAGIACLGAVYLAVLIFKPDLYQGLASLGLGLFAVLAGIIAVQGRRKTLRELIAVALFLPNS